MHATFSCSIVIDISPNTIDDTKQCYSSLETVITVVIVALPEILDRHDRNEGESWTAQLWYCRATVT